MSDDKNTRAASGVKFSQFQKVGPQEGNPIEVVGLRDGENVRADLTTDLVNTNPEITFRNAKGQFAAIDPGLLALDNQLKVNRYLWDRIQDLDSEEPEPEAIIGAFRFAHAEGTPPLLKGGEMVFSSPWGTLEPSEIMTLRISTLDSKSDPIPDGIFEANKEFSLYRSQAGLPIKVATFSPYMVNKASYQTGGEYYELALDTNKTQFFEQCEEGVDYFLSENVHNFERTPATAWFGISDVRGDYVLIKEKEELDDFFAEENWRFWSGYNLWANTVTEAHPYLVWKDIHSIQLPSYDVGPINYSGKTRLDEYISEGMTIKIVDRFAFENYGVYEVLEFKKVQAPTWYSWNDILDPDKDPSGYVDSYHLKVKCIEGRGESLLNKTGGSSGFGLHSEDEAELSPEEIAAVSSSPVQRFWIAKATGEGPTDRLVNRESVSTLPTFGSRYAPDQSDTLIGAFNRDYRAPDYHLDVQHYNRIDHINSRGEEYDYHYGGGTTTFIGQGWSRYDKAYYEFTYDWSSKPGAGRDLDNFNHVQVQDPELPVNKARTTVTFAVESVPRVRFYCSDTEDENSIVTEIKTAVAIGASRKTHPLYMYWREEFDNTHYYNQIKRLGDPSEEYDATNKKYVDNADQHLHTLIDELEQEIDVIAPRLEAASYTYSASPAVKPGEMHIISGSFTSGTDVILFNDVALDGKTHTWAELNVGDYIEVTDTLQARTAENYAMYLVSKAPEGTGLKQIDVALVKGQGAPKAGDVMDAKGFQLGGNDINDLDARYAEKGHKHSGADITSGTVAIARLPTGTTSTTVAVGNHNHSGVYAPANHTHSGLGGWIEAKHGSATTVEYNHNTYGCAKFFAKVRRSDGYKLEATYSKYLKDLGEVKFVCNSSGLEGKFGKRGMLIGSKNSTPGSYPLVVMNIWTTTEKVEYGYVNMIFEGVVSWVASDTITFGETTSHSMYWTWVGEAK